MTRHLAQLNVGRLVAPVGAPRVAELIDDLPANNAVADDAPGFVWRLVGDNGADALDVDGGFGDGVFVNLSTWESVEQLRAFAYRSKHLEYLRRRREWFEILGDVYEANWWVPRGHRPSVAEARDRLAMLREHGSTAEAFRLRDADRWSG